MILESINKVDQKINLMISNQEKDPRIISLKEEFEKIKSFIYYKYQKESPQINNQKNKNIK